MNIRPLTGQVLVEVETQEVVTAAGIVIPEVHLSAQAVEASHQNPTKPTGKNIGLVRAIGPWPKLPNGMARLPEFGIGHRVLFNPWRGTQLQREYGARLRLIPYDDILAVFNSC